MYDGEGVKKERQKKDAEREREGNEAWSGMEWVYVQELRGWAPCWFLRGW